jgi:autotransporter-associated beta strand protein
VANQTNYGNYQVDPGGAMSFLRRNNTPSTYNWLSNAGALTVNGGTMWMGANVWQAGAGHITVTGNGVLTLTGTTDGGTIQINSGMLNFAPTQFAPGPVGASNLKSSISFTGQTGEINLGEAIQSATYDATGNDIKVMVPWKGNHVQAADFHLAGSYAANQFTYDLSKGLIDFHRTPTS